MHASQERSDAEPKTRTSEPSAALGYQAFVSSNAGRTLKEGRRRLVRQSQHLRRDEKRMLQGILSAQFGVADRVREEQPRGAGLEMPELARSVFLKFVVRFQEMMQAQHEFVVFGPLHDVGLKETEDPLP